MNSRLAAATLSLAAAACAFTPTAAAQEVAGVFGQGRTHFIVSGGTGYAFDNSYLILGAGANYYLTDGFNVGLHVEWWTGADPGMTKITPSLQYVFYQVPRVKPYVGVFYRRTNIADLPDLDSAGARAGLYFEAGRNAYLGAGLVYESYRDCSPSVYRKCDSTYAEVSLTFAF